MRIKDERAVVTAGGAAATEAKAEHHVVWIALREEWAWLWWAASRWRYSSAVQEVLRERLRVRASRFRAPIDRRRWWGE